MATSEDQVARADFRSLSNGAQLHVLLPQDSEHDLVSILGAGSADWVSRVLSRKTLYFDETASLLLVLKTKIKDHDLRSLLPKLELVLTAHATDAIPQGANNTASASGKHDLSAQTVSASEGVDVLTSNGHTYAIWKPTIHLPWPRVRFQRPAVYFTAYLSLTAQAKEGIRRGELEMLQSFQTIPANILEPLHYDPAFSDSKIHISESLLTRVESGLDRTKGEDKPIRGASKRAFPIVPALLTRIKYSALPGATIASLHLEASRLAMGHLTLQSVTLDIPEADVTMLTSLQEQGSLLPGDETVLLHRVEQAAYREAIADSLPVCVSVAATLVQEDVSPITLRTELETTIDLSHMSIKSSYKWSRPLSSVSQQPQRLSLKDLQQPSAHDMSSQSPDTDSGIIFTFGAKPTVTIHEEFRLRIQCINKTNRTRRFTALWLPPKQCAAQTTAEEPTLESSSGGHSISLEGFFKALPRELEVPAVVCHDPDVRIGPLAPEAIFEADMRFTATTIGSLDLGFIRVLDIDARRTVDVKEMPAVIALERSPGDEDHIFPSKEGFHHRLRLEVGDELDEASRVESTGTLEASVDT